MRLFFIVAFTLIAVGTAYLARRFQRLPLVSPCGRVGRRAVAWLLALGLSFGAFYFRSWLIALFLYLLLGYLLTDVAGYYIRRFAARRGRLRWARLYRGGATVWAAALLICLGGYINTRFFTVKRYTVAIDKALGGDGRLRIVLVTDTHLGTAVDERLLRQLPETVNALAPDLILLGGDIYDERSREEDAVYSLEVWRQLRSRYGVFYVTGNHEESSYARLWQPLAELQNRLSDAGVRVLNDATELIDGRFYLIGRIDPPRTRRPLPELLRGVDPARPLLLLAHQPTNIEAARLAGIDLMLSGHTHRGQLFPFGAVARMMYGVLYGHYRFDRLNLLISSGLGSWSFALRTAGRPEIVLVELIGSDG